MFRAIPLLFAALVLAGCAQRAQGAGADATPIVPHAGTAAGDITNAGAADKLAADKLAADTGAADTGVPRTVSIAIAPAAGYAGTFVGVTGAGWPPSAMVLIKLADALGRSPVLAAVAADAKGEFTTGFVYPVGERWLHPGPATVVAGTENGQTEITASFDVAPPADVVPPTATPIAVSTATPAVAATIAAAPTVTPTIPFTSGALAATAAPTVAPTATPVPPATATPAPTAMAIPTVPPTAVTTSTPTSTAVATPQASPTAYPSPVSTIDELIAAINRMPPSELAPELANSLVQKLNNAQKQLDKGHATPASNMLRAFQHEVAAQWEKKIDDAAANFLSASADNVIANLQQGQHAGNGAGSNDDDHGNGKGDGEGSGKGNGKGKGNDQGNDKGNSNGNGNGKGKGKGHGHG